MAKRKRSTAMKPIDIREIRKKLGLSMCRMGQQIAFYGRVPSIPETRVNEWEFGFRPVPDYVYTAVSHVLLDYWSDDRHKTPTDKQREVDIFYGTLLNQPLGELFKLELGLTRSRSPKLRHLAQQVRKARIEQMKYLERVLHVQMAYVFDPEPGPGSELEVVA